MKWTLPILTLCLATAGACSEAPGEGELLAEAHAAVPVADTGQFPHLRRIAAARSANHDYRTGRPSRDGRYIPYVDWTTGDVAIHDFAADGARNLTNKGTWGENGSWAEGAILSPDGRQVVFLYGNVQTAEDANFMYELRLINADGTGQRVLRTLKSNEVYLSPMDWDAELGILLEQNYSGGNEGPADLVLMNPETLETRLILSTEAGTPHPHRASFSPDARLIAAQRGEAVEVLDLSGREVAHSPWGRLVGWTPTGDGLVTYGTHASGETGFWRLPFDGSRLGAPELVRGSVYGAHPLGAAEDRYYYTVLVDAPQVHAGTLDLRGGEVIATPAAVGTPVEGGTSSPAWSPDGRSLAYLRSTLGGRETELMLRSADGTEVRSVAIIDLPQARHLQWHPDGSSLYLTARPNKWALYRIGLEQGEVSKVAEPVEQGFALSPDGRRVYVRRSGDGFWGGENGIAGVDLATGEEIWFVPTEAPVGTNLTVTPDGQVLFTVSGRERESLELLEADGRGRRTLTTVARPDFISPQGSLTSAPAGEILYLIWRQDSERNRELWAVPRDGGEPRFIMDGVGPQFALHPDGRRFAVQTGEWRHEVWAMEGVQAALKGR